MRKNSVRKWLHAILDLLPLFVIPVFALAVRSDNNFEPISIEYGDKKTVVNYAFESNEVNSIDDIQLNRIYKYDNFDFYIGDDHYYDYQVRIYYFDDANYLQDFFDNATMIESTFEYVDLKNSSIILYSMSDPDGILEISMPDGYIDYEITEDDEIIFHNVIMECIDGLIDFKQLVSDSYSYMKPNYTDYNIIESVEEVDTTVTYDNTDVGSQMIYTLYETVDKYFNFNQVGTFNDMYEWVQTNIFNGSIPLVVPIVWNIILYEFIMDILFLFYAVFMFIVDFAESMIDRAFYKAHKGCD